MNIDLTANKIDGRKVMPRVCELAYALQAGPLSVIDIIPKVYGLNAPDDAASAVKQIAFRARKAGLPVSVTKRRGGCYRLG